MDILSFVGVLGRMAAGLAGEEHRALETVGRLVREESQRVIGTYDYGWQQLAASTLEKKAADTPLLEEGKLRSSIQTTVQGDTAYVGSDSMIAVYQEMGTATIPPRSFLLEAAVHMEPEVVRILGGRIHAYLSSVV